MNRAQAFANWTKKLIYRRRESYRRLFLDDQGNLSPDALIVMADLKRFCNLSKSSIRLDQTGAVDALAMAVSEGRREVINRVLSYLFIDEKVIQTLNEME